MADYSALQTLWATLPPDDSTDQKLAAVNAMTVAVPPELRTIKDEVAEVVPLPTRSSRAAGAVDPRPTLPFP